MKKQSMYMWQCVMCQEYMYSEDILLKHCNRLVQWINGIEGKGIDMNSPIVKIHVTGYIEISQENLDVILAHDDPHTSLIYSIHMGYVNAKELTFDLE